MNSPFSFLLFLLGLFGTFADVSAQCEPSYTDFGSSSQSDIASLYVAVSPANSYSITNDGLNLFLRKPDGTVTTDQKNGVNDKTGDGATVNSTFSFLHGKVTFEVSAPRIPGVITAMITIGDGSLDEIDIEILGSEPNNFQTNVFVPVPSDTSPNYGKLSSREDVNDIAVTHAYAIDWNAERIQWSLDGKVIRTLNKGDSKIEGKEHYPTHSSRVQMGIWDASSPEGTSAWAGGPIDWEKAPNPVVAVVKSVRVECH